MHHRDNVFNDSNWGHLNLFDFHFPGLDFRDIENVIHDREEMLAVAFDGCHILESSFSVIDALSILNQEIRKTP